MVTTRPALLRVPLLVERRAVDVVRTGADAVLVPVRAAAPAARSEAERLSSGPFCWAASDRSWASAESAFESCLLQAAAAITKPSTSVEILRNMLTLRPIVIVI